MFTADGNFSIGKIVTALFSFQVMLTKNHLSRGPFLPVLIHVFPPTCANTCISSSGLPSFTSSHILNRHSISRSISHLVRTTERPWTKLWWHITANHRQLYDTINSHKQGRPSWGVLTVTVLQFFTGAL